MVISARNKVDVTIHKCLSRRWFQVKVVETVCEKCSAYKLSVDFQKENTPLEEGTTKRVGEDQFVIFLVSESVEMKILRNIES